jgi:hypothetical protein
MKLSATYAECAFSAGPGTTPMGLAKKLSFTLTTSSRTRRRTVATQDGSRHSFGPTDLTETKDASNIPDKDDCLNERIYRGRLGCQAPFELGHEAISENAKRCGVTGTNEVKC